MESKKYTSIISISEIDEITENDARRTFFSYKEKGIILDGLFDDDIWSLSDEYAHYSFDFTVNPKQYTEFGVSMVMSIDDFKKYLKTFIICLMGDLSLSSLQSLILHAKKITYSFKEDFSQLLDNETQNWAGRLSDFFNMIPTENREAQVSELLNILDEAEENNRRKGGQRTLATFDSYFCFDDIIRRYWSEATNEDEKLFFFPIWLWWNASGVLPLRPREFVLTPRNCLSQVNGEYRLTVRRNRIKGSGKTKGYNIQTDYVTKQYSIPKNLADEILWYQEKTKDCPETELNTLFVTETHYALWEHKAPYTSRFYTYANLRTCLRYFYLLIIQERYGYKVLFERSSANNLSSEKEIEYLHLGDTRHIALINLILEGATPMVAMMLAGHDTPDMSAHYFSNISSLVECRTYRQYIKTIKGSQSYRLSGPASTIKVEEYIILPDGSRCYSKYMRNNEFEDCYKASGPAGEVGLCSACTYHRAKDKPFHDSQEMYKNRIEADCQVLSRIVDKVRHEKGDPEELTSILLRLRDDSYSYQQYLYETKEANHVQI